MISARIVEIGTVKVANKTVDPSEIIPPLKKIIREATKDDLERDERNSELELEAALICKKKIEEQLYDVFRKYIM